MRALRQFTPYLTGPVLSGIAGPYAEIELQLYPDSAKDVELFLLERNIAFETSEGRRFSGDRTRSVSIFTLDWDGAPVRLSVLDPRDERIALKTTLAGRVTERAGIAEVGELVVNVILLRLLVHARSDDDEALDRCNLIINELMN